MSADDLNAAPRCTARRRKSHERCMAPAVHGLEVCRMHGGSSPQSREKSERVRATAVLARQMAKFVTPIDADDPEASPQAGFDIEYRRTVGRIRYLDTLIDALSDRDLTFGVTKIEEIAATEFGGTNVTYEARVNALIELQRWERTHLLAMQKIFISAKLDLRRLEIAAKEVEMLERAQIRILVSLGHDANDPNVRAVVQRELSALPQSENPTTPPPIGA